MDIRMFPLMLALGSMLCASAETSGHASVEWIPSATAALPGKPLDTAIRIRIDQGWHIYWTNPGDGGMKTEFRWRLPDGWKAEGPWFPAPSHYMTGGLGSYGHEGTVLFPVRLTPPADFAGQAEPRLAVAWLACNEGACVPGEAEVSLRLSAGEAVASPEEAVVADAWKRAPTAAPPGLSLKVTESDRELLIAISGRLADSPDLGGAAAFPLTPQVVDPSRVMRFETSAGGWRTRIGRSEYATSPVISLSLLIVPAHGMRPFELSWRAKSD